MTKEKIKSLILPEGVNFEEFKKAWKELDEITINLQRGEWKLVMHAIERGIDDDSTPQSDVDKLCTIIELLAKRINNDD